MLIETLYAHKPIRDIEYSSVGESWNYEIAPLFWKECWSTRRIDDGIFDVGSIRRIRLRNPWWRRRVSAVFAVNLVDICLLFASRRSFAALASSRGPRSLNRSSPRTLSPSLKMIRFWLARSDKQCNSALRVSSKRWRALRFSRD